MSDSSDYSDLLETCANDPYDRRDQDLWDIALLHCSDCSDRETPCHELSRLISWYRISLITSPGAFINSGTF